MSLFLTALNRKTSHFPNTSPPTKYQFSTYLFFNASPITLSPNIQSGEPVFAQTRVPVKNLFGYLKTGYSLHQFTNDFPSVSKEQTIQVIEHLENGLSFQPAGA